MLRNSTARLLYRGVVLIFLYGIWGALMKLSPPPHPVLLGIAKDALFVSGLFISMQINDESA